MLSMSVKVERVRHPLACFSGEILVNGQKTASAGEINWLFDYFPLMDGSSEEKPDVEVMPVNGVV